MEIMERQINLFDERGKIINLKKEREPEIKVVKNTYSTAGGLVEEILIRKFYQSRMLNA